MATGTRFEYTRLAPLAETFALQGSDVIWNRTWVAPVTQAAVKTVDTLAAEDPKIEAVQAQVRDSPALVM